MKIIKTIVISAVILLLLDFSFISTIYKPFSDQIVNVQRVTMKFRPEGALVCYALMIFGLYYFILKNRRSPMDAFFLGLVINGVYESTNYATLKKWQWSIAAIDTLWGGILMSLTTFLTYSLYPMVTFIPI